MSANEARERERERREKRQVAKAYHTPEQFFHILRGNIFSKECKVPKVTNMYAPFVVILLIKGFLTGTQSSTVKPNMLLTFFPQKKSIYLLRMFKVNVSCTHTILMK